jgi:integrase
MKMRQSQIVPLSHQATEIVREVHALTKWSEWIFPNQIEPRKHMSDGTVLGALKRLGYKGRMTGHGFRSCDVCDQREAWLPP